MAAGLAIKMRRVGQRRTLLVRRLRPVYEIVISDGDDEVYRTTTVTPLSVLANRGKIHTTDTRDWVDAADNAYSPYQESWISMS